MTEGRRPKQDFQQNAPESRKEQLESEGVRQKSIEELRSELNSEEFYRRIFRYCRRLTPAWRPNPEDEARDATQDTMIRALKALSRFHSERSSLFTWVCGIAERVVQGNQKRMNIKSYRDRNLLNTVSLDDPEKSPRGVRTDSADVIEAIDSKSRAAVAEQVLSTFPERERKIWKMRVDGRQSKDIAIALGMNENTVRQILFTMRGKIAEQLPKLIQRLETVALAGGVDEEEMKRKEWAKKILSKRRSQWILAAFFMGLQNSKAIAKMVPLQEHSLGKYIAEVQQALRVRDRKGILPKAVELGLIDAKKVSFLIQKKMDIEGTENPLVTLQGEYLRVYQDLLSRFGYKPFRFEAAGYRLETFQYFVRLGYVINMGMVKGYKTFKIKEIKKRRYSYYRKG